MGPSVNMTPAETQREELVAIYRQGDYSGLIDYCTRKLTECQCNYLLYGARGKANTELEEYSKAIEDLSQALLLNDTYQKGRYNRGLAYYFLNEYTQAIADLEVVKGLGLEIEINFVSGSLLLPYQSA